MPDFLLCLNGRFVALELKKPGEEPRVKQEREMKWIREAGGITWVLDDYDDVKFYVTGVLAGLDPSADKLAKQAAGVVRARKQPAREAGGKGLSRAG